MSFPTPTPSQASTRHSARSSRRVVALGGGHGLAASLSALRHVTDSLTAIVTVADDGGSSGRLREELGVLPPGDLRMALAALCGDSEWGRTWSEVVQHRFVSRGSLHGHAVGNLLLVALWERFGRDPVAGLEWMGRLLGVEGRVLPMAAVPLDITARVQGADPTRPEDVTSVRGQVAVASTAGRVLSVALIPEDPPVCREVLDALAEADEIVLGPGSWFTSVLPHVLVPALAKALAQSPARRTVALNLVAQQGETSGFAPETYLEVLAAHAPSMGIDVVLADVASVGAPDSLRRVVDALGARLVLAPVAMDGGVPRHDPVRLAAAYGGIFAERGT